MSDESDNYYISDGEIDDKKHDKLVDDILNLNKIQNVKKPSRTEPALKISEFNLVKSVTGNKGSVHLNELTKALRGRKKHEELSNKFKSTSGKSRTLPTPLEKPQADRIRRSVNYEKSRLKLDRWEALVTSNRAASHLVFPLDSVEKLKIEEKKSEAYPTTWRLKSELQTELGKLEPKVKEYIIDTEDKDKFPLTLEELKEQRKEAAKLRAHQSFKEAKARRQNKIKSKKYHRILKREKIKEKLKEFEQLQKTNPEEALRKLEDIEKARAEERFSLRHKGTGQWAKNKQIRAKYDKESRQVLSQQLAISRDLTQKLKSADSDSDDEGIESEENSRLDKVDKNNPWVAGVKPTEEVVDFVSGYRKYWNEQQNQLGRNEDNTKNNEKHEISNDEVKVKKADSKISKAEIGRKSIKRKKNVKKDNRINVTKKKVKPNLNDSTSTSEWEVSLLQENNDVEDIFNQLEDKLEQKLREKFRKVKGISTNKKRIKNTSHDTVKKKVDLTMPSKSKKHIIDAEMIEQPRSANENEEIPDDNSLSDLNRLKSILNTVDDDKQASDIDPNKFIQVTKTNLNTAIPDILMTDENEEDDQTKVILEAFEDDDIAADFEKEKAEEIEKNTPKDIDLNLPGWGSWGGANINPSKRKRKRFIIKMPPKMPRRDENKGSLIIDEKAQSKVKPHMVSEVPFPFKTVKDYEASIRAPIGNTFVPETAFRKLIEPSVTTKMGAIIEPISKSILMGKKK